MPVCPWDRPGAAWAMARAVAPWVKEDLMRFGIFYEHQLPRPWGPDSEHKLLSDALEQIELADRSGIDYVWEVEHHFLEEYSHSSAPEVFLAAASQRTKRIRLGHGIVQAPSAVNHPARIAERVATLDLVSAAGSTSAPGRRAPRPSSAASAWPARPSARCGRRPSTPSRGCSRSSRSPATTGTSSRCRRATCCPGRCRSRIRRSGWPAAAGRPSTSPRAAASARCRSRSSSRRTPRTGSPSTTT